MTAPFRFFRKLKDAGSPPPELGNWLEAIPVPAALLDSEARAVGANNRVRELFARLSRRAGSTDDWRDAIAPEDRQTVLAQLIGAGDDPVTAEFRVQTAADGSADDTLWLRVSLGPAAELSGEPATPRHRVAVFEDITARHRLANQAERDRHMLNAILDSSPDLIFLKDAECRYLISNRAHLRRVGKQSLSEIVGKTVFDLFPRERAEIAYAAEKEIVDTGIPKLNLREDDEGISYLSNKVPFRSEEGRVMGFVGISRDITELQEVQNALEQAKEEAEAGTRAKSEFLANMSHEIRTPMNAVIGMTGLLLETPLTHEQRDFVETIRNSGDALLSIINDILDFSKIESGNIELERRPFELRGCIEEALDILSTQASKKGLDLVYLIQEPCPATLVGDVTRLRQVLVNLISNAVKFTPKGEVFVQVAAERIADDKFRVQFSVTDTGIGIRKEDMSRLFRSFSQVDASTTREYGGTGLGLAISSRLCQIMGGELSCESEYGKGSTFRFSILTDVARGEPRVYLRSEQPQLEGKNILIVDDNPTNRQILTLQTKSWGMLPVAAASGAEAIELLEQGKKFDVALLDWHMPEMDGITLARKLQENPGTCTLPLVMLTSRATIQSAAAEGVRFEAHLTKPVKASHLFNLLIQHFSRNGRDHRYDPRDSDKPAGGRRLQILLAEDNLVNQKVALLTLKKLGHDVEVVSNGHEVLAAIEKRAFDAILMDVQMPDLDGLETTRRIRAARSDALQPWIIAMTANAMTEDREICLASGMNDYLSKPVKMDALEKALTAVPVTKPE